MVTSKSSASLFIERRGYHDWWPCDRETRMPLDRRLQIADEAQQERARQERHERRREAIAEAGDLDPLVVLPRVVSHARDAHRQHLRAGATEPRLTGACALAEVALGRPRTQT